MVPPDLRAATKRLTSDLFVGAAVFIVGGGPSLCGFDFARLRGRRVVTCNMAFLDVPWADVAYVADQRLMLRLAGEEPEWRRFAGIRAWRDNGHAARLAAEGRIIMDHALPESRQWSRRIEDGVIDTGNAGMGAVQLADACGAESIYLLGFDGVAGNYHDHYPRSWQASQAALDRMMSREREWAAACRAPVVNLNPDSHWTAWPKAAPETVLA